MATQQEQQFSPRLNRDQTRTALSRYKDNPQYYNVEQLRQHASHYNLPFYEGDFSLLDAVTQAAGGFIEGFTTLEVVDPPDNEYEAIVRNISHLAGFVPGILSGPLRALGLMNAARATSALKSIPMWGADKVTRVAKKIARPVFKGGLNSKYKAMDSASNFMLADKAKHIAEGAFHLGVASSISSVWDGVDQMMHSFAGGALAGGVFRGIGNIFPGTEAGDKALRTLSGSLFMGLHATHRGATTPEQIYEYLLGAYFGGKEMPWYRTKAHKGMVKFDKEALTNPKLEWERNPEEMKGWDDYHPMVQKEIKKLSVEKYATPEDMSAVAYDLMKQHGIADKIPAEEYTTKGYEILSAIRKGVQKPTRKKAHEILGVAASGGAKGADAYWSRVLEKYGLPVLHYMPETSRTKGVISDFFTRKKTKRVFGIDVGLSETQLLEAGPALDRANITLKRKELSTMKPSSYELISGNYHQIKNTNAVYAVGAIEHGQTGTRASLNGKTVKGGAGWGVQMAIDKGMTNVFVFDQPQKRWFQWSNAKNRFVKIDEAPKLSRNSAVIGTRNLTPAGKQAIKDVAEKTFGIIPIQKSKAKDAIPQKDVPQFHVKTLENIKNIRDEIISREKELEDVELDIKEGKVGRVALKQLKKDKQELKREIKEWGQELQRHERLSKTQHINYDTNDVINDIDTGMIGDSFPLMKKGEYFANEHLKKVWDVKDKEGLISKRTKMLEAGKKTEEVIRKYTEVGEKNVKSEDAIRFLEKELGLKENSLSEEAQRSMKKWLTEQNLGKQVIFIKTVGGKVVNFTDPSRPTATSGKRLRQVEPPKLIEEIYLLEGGKLEKGVGAPLVVFDSIGLRNKRGFSVDVPLNNLVWHLKISENMKEVDAIAKANGLKAKVIKDMIKDNNMYPLGGQGDKGRIVFVKLHPNSRKNYKAEYLNVIKALRTKDKKALTLLNKDKRLSKSIGISEDNFKKMVVSNVMYDLSMNGYEYSPNNIKTILEGNFIPSAIGYNKRAQIWMTNGYSGNKEYIKDLVDDLSPENNYRYVLIGDPKKPKGLSSLKALNIQLPEHVDGAIIVRDDVINAINKDAAHPVSGQNKSFIIDNTPDFRGNSMGALLGKYMMHTAGKTATDAMKKEGVHMMIMTSAAKQTGTRKVGNYDVGKNGELLLKGTEHYELDPGSVKYNSSVINDKHMAQKQIWVKQLFTNLHQYGHSPISEDIISDIHKEVIEKAFNGNATINKELASYIKTLDNSKIENLLRNLEDIGTNELISALKTPGAERFAEGAMQKMLRIVEKDIEHSFQDGSISVEERANSLTNIRESISPIDRLLKNVAIVGEEAAKQGKAGFSGYLHKHIRDYRAAVLHNYFVKSITRPSVDNSAVARIRPYDKWMQKDFADLNKRDDIFYLDKAYEKTRIKTAINAYENTTLGKLWRAYERGDFDKQPKIKKEVENVFESVVLRVPMDSISGAHKLKFKGFTGRDGHGIMMHSKTMRALGGADLDGDEAFIYFGGKAEDGTGFGMKKSWKDAIHANKEEFYDKGDVKDNKNDFRKLLTIGAEKDNPMKTSKSLYYSPYSRLKASEGAVAGRNLLGVVVSQSQNMRSAYNSLMGAEGKKDVFKTRIGKNTYRVTLTPKTSNKERKYQRELTRAQIAFGSDPLDEVGLKHPDVFFNTLYDAYFNKSFEKYNPKTRRYTKSKEPEYKPYHLKEGLLGSYVKMNQAYFGKNYVEGRNFTMDEVNFRAAEIGKLLEAQKNTILPKMVETLEGLDWSDNLFQRLDLEITQSAYKEINDMVKEFKWLKPLMRRASFKVPYNKHIDVVIGSKLYNRYVRRELVENDSVDGLKRVIKLINHTPWKRELDNKKNRRKFMVDSDYRLNMLNSIVRQAEDFMSNDLADMATLLNLKRLFKTHKFDPKKISQIHHRTEMFKARSYLAPKERRALDTGAYLDTIQNQKDRKITQKIFDELYGKEIKDLKGDERSAAWDQAQLDRKIVNYKAKLTVPEKELFDHLMIGTFNRGRYAEVMKYLDKLSTDAHNPMLRDLVTKLIKQASGTKQSRLAINSEAISDIAIQNHFRAMNDVYGKMWEQPTEESIKEITNKTIEDVKEKGIGRDKNIMDELVQGAHKESGYAGIKKGEITKEDKKTITTIATILKRYNNKIGNNIPDLNEQIRGILLEATGKAKDLNAMHKQDFEVVKNWLVEAENGTMFQRLWRTTNPEIQKRYYALFPNTVNRELMAYDIKWLKKEGIFINKDGKAKKGIIRRPTYFLEMLQNWIHKSNNLAQGKAETLSKEVEDDFLHLEELEDGNGLFKVAIAQRELGIKKSIDKAFKKGDITEGERKSYHIVYDKLRTDAEKEFNWKKMKDREYVITNTEGERVTATGFEIVNGSKSKSLPGIKKIVTKKFESLFKLVEGDKKAFEKYKTGKFFDPETRTQPRMNWKLFVKDAEKAFERGDEIPMDIGIDGMRHVMRSMMHDLGHRNNQYGKWIFKKTPRFNFDSYWPHMFFDKGAAELNMRKAIEKIQKDPTLSKEDRQKDIQDLVVRHQSLTGDWEFGDMNDWDRVDVFEMRGALSNIAELKAAKKDKTIKWTDMNVTTGSLLSRKGHVAGWSTDMTVMDAYIKSITSTYYRQLNQIMGRNVIDNAYQRMKTKFGPELATKWSNYFKLYVQGAMGQPDVIPEEIYNDSSMKLKGTPFAWWADNRVLDRVNSIRERLGIRESDLPKELKDFTYQDLRNWSNMEAKFELASLLAHPKTAVTNIFGGSLHTIQSVGPGALMKARSIKYLKRINPNWKSMKDVDEFVVKKGVVPEFMLHELGLGVKAKGFKNIEKFIGELSSKINSNDPIEKKEIRSLGKKYGLTDTVVAAAGKFMSIPERMLRRDAFMAHYIRAWERFGGTITDPNHPFLIEMAKKGVKATQFLYEAPFRPFFARTALGKIMSRFQLYAWNSIRFRNDVIREAARYGFKPGSESFEKYRRTMTIDLFVVALANMFLYSLFDTALPQPYSWMQDTANWMFGNERERERAFYGTYPTAIAPLQVVSPPIARIPMSNLMAWARNDIGKLTDYQIYTFFPFGRMYRDLFQEDRGLIDNPSRLPEKLLGMPLQDLTRKIKKSKKEEDTYSTPKPGFKF